MQALLLEQQDGKTLASVQTLDESRLPEGDVTVDVHWSSLNYKDALAITGKGKIIRNFPMIPGIDFAGTVRTSEDPRFHAGQEVGYIVHCTWIWWMIHCWNSVFG